MSTKPPETAAAISVDDLRMVSNQIGTEFTQTFAGVFAQRRTWRKAAAYTVALTAKIIQNLYGMVIHLL